uniref:Uncharacterized protein n=1 Tax=Tetradesmus obliquus TaxID=3088 RepID=A0A383V720_TETOB|eukprot:jgi/Sobl393_1/10676/SZX74712.1
MQSSPGASADVQSAAEDLLGKLQQARTDLQRTASAQQQHHAASGGHVQAPTAADGTLSPDIARDMASKDVKDDSNELSPFATHPPVHQRTDSNYTSAASSADTGNVFAAAAAAAAPDQPSTAAAAAAAAPAGAPADDVPLGGSVCGDDVKAAADNNAAAAAAAAGGAGDGKATGDRPPSSNGQQGGKRLIPLRAVLQHSYEYHGLNELAMFCVTALAVTLVLYWHWGSFTAIFKAGVQRSFSSYGNPDWQSQTMVNVDTMHDAVEYSTGWSEFWLQRAEDVDWNNTLIRAGEYGDVRYSRMIVNIQRNCDGRLSPNLECYTDDPLTQQLRNGSIGKQLGMPGKTWDNLLEYAGWERLALPSVRDSTKTQSPWWAYTLVAPKYGGAPANRSQFLGRLYNITRATSLNINNCDWLATDCSNSSSSNPCKEQSVPNNGWFDKICNSSGSRDVAIGSFIQRGSGFFVRDPQPQADGPAVLDLKPWLSKFAYSIGLDVLAANAMDDARDKKHKRTDRDRAVFSMLFQRSAGAEEKPDRVLWQITSTVPVRTSFYTYSVDWERIGFEALLYLCMIFVMASQVWQFRVCQIQFKSGWKFFSQYWNIYEVMSTVLTLAWIVFYWVLYFTLLRQHSNWDFDSWDIAAGSAGHAQLNDVMTWSYYYGAWLYFGIVVDFVIFLRIARYMRIHRGLKAFYQVFIIAAREFLDFAVFLLFILVLLGSAVFAFFQLTGGNFQFLRFADGLSLMSRLTFGFLSYEDFQSQALGVGAAVSAVTLLFWVAVLLLVVYTQNIILAIVAEAYEEAKSSLGTAETSFLMLVIMRIIFSCLFVIYRARMFGKDMLELVFGRQFCAGSQATRTMSGFRGGSAPDFGSNGGSGAGHAFSSSTSPRAVTSYASAASGAGAPRSSFAASDAMASPFEGDGSNNTLATDSQLLAPTMSYMPLPPDVESGLRRSQHSFVPARQLTGSRTGSKIVSRNGGSRLRAFQVLSGKVATHNSLPEIADTAAAVDAEAGAVGCGGAAGGADDDQRCVMMEQQLQVPSLRQRARNLWNGLFGERHDVRMYKDLLVKQHKHDQGWIASYKARYWLPWCVARTRPVLNLVHLYQEFTSYKLRYTCTWEEADKLGQKIFAPDAAAAAAAAAASSGHLLATQHSVLPTVPSSKDASAGGGSTACCTSPGPSSLPPLAEDTYVDKDTLSRLFLVSSQVAKEVKVFGWFGPFRELTGHSVGYLVDGIAQVHGIDEDEAQRIGAVAWTSDGSSSSGGGAGGLGYALAAAGSSGMRSGSVDLGGGQRERRGFVAGLNAKRRGGDKIELLMRAQRRMEENGIKLQNQLAMQLANYQQRVNHTESKLGEQLRAMSQKLEAISHQTAAAVAAAAAPAAATASLAPGQPPAAAERALSSSQRVNTLSKAAHAISPAIKWATSSRRGSSFAGAAKGSRQSAPGTAAAAAAAVAAAGPTAAAAEQHPLLAAPAAAAAANADDLQGLNAVAEGGDAAAFDAAANAGPGSDFGSASDMAAFAAAGGGPGRSALSRSASAVSRASAASGASVTSGGDQQPAAEGEVLQQMQAMQQQMQAMVQMLQQLQPQQQQQ